MIEAPAAAISLGRRFEGLRLKPYLCPARVPTIGYGTTRYPNGIRVTLSDAQISLEMAEEYLVHEMNACARAAMRLCPVLDGEHDGRLAAITDFVYNLGAGRLETSTLRRRINARDWRAAEKELRRWVHEGAMVLPGLVLRREAEIALMSHWIGVRLS